VVIDKIVIERIAIGKPEHNTPVARNRQRPTPSEISAQAMHPQAGNLIDLIRAAALSRRNNARAMRRT
jgi:hypothetical protein